MWWPQSTYHFGSFGNIYHLEIEIAHTYTRLLMVALVLNTACYINFSVKEYRRSSCCRVCERYSGPALNPRLKSNAVDAAGSKTQKWISGKPLHDMHDNTGLRFEPIATPETGRNTRIAVCPCCGCRSMPDHPTTSDCHSKFSTLSSARTLITTVFSPFRDADL